MEAIAKGTFPDRRERAPSFIP